MKGIILIIFLPSRLMFWFILIIWKHWVILFNLIILYKISTRHHFIETHYVASKYFILFLFNLWYLNIQIGQSWILWAPILPFWILFICFLIFCTLVQVLKNIIVDKSFKLLSKFGLKFNIFLHIRYFLFQLLSNFIFLLNYFIIFLHFLFMLILIILKLLIFLVDSFYLILNLVL